MKRFSVNHSSEHSENWDTGGVSVFYLHFWTWCAEMVCEAAFPSFTWHQQLNLSLTCYGVITIAKTRFPHDTYIEKQRLTASQQICKQFSTPKTASSEGNPAGHQVNERPKVNLNWTQPDWAPSMLLCNQDVWFNHWHMHKLCLTGQIKDFSV